MRNPNRHASWIIILILSLWSLSLAQTPPEIRELEQGKPIERELAGGEVHAYSIKLTVGQFLSVIVDQRGIDVTVALYEPDGEIITGVDSPSGAQGAETVSLGAEVSGLYLLKVRPFETEIPAGRYTVKIEELRLAKPEDGDRIAAEKASAQAALRLNQGTIESRQNAIEKYKAALLLWRAAGDRRREATTLYRMSEVYYSLEEFQKALDSYQKSLLIWEEVADRAIVANTLIGIGRVYEILGEKQHALDFFNRALLLRRELGNVRGEANTLFSIGNAYNLVDEKQKALDSFNQALLLYRTLGNRQGEAYTLHAIGEAYKSMGEYQAALNYYNQALLLWRALNRRVMEANTLHYIGEAYWLVGEHSQALDHYTQSLVIRRRASDLRGEAYVLTSIGTFYSSQGEHQRAVDCFNQALPLHQAVGNRQGEAYTLHYAGEAYTLMREHKQALDVYNRALLLRRAVGERRGEAYDLHNIGTTYHSLGEEQKALDYLTQALSVRRAIRDHSGEAATLHAIARLERDGGNLVKARTHIEAALDITETLRYGIASQELRISYRATVQKYYEFHIELLMRLYQQDPAAGHDAAALQASERARARSLLEALGEARADIRQGVDPAVLSSERTLQQRLNATAERQTRLLTDKHTEEQVATVKKEIAALTREFQDLRAQIRQRSPRYAALTQPVPLSVQEIQTKVLDADTLLLEYALGEERSYLWAVTRTSISSHELPKRADIEAAVRRAVTLLSDGKQWATSDRIQAEYAEVAGRLSQILLAPVAAQLKGKRLLIVGDGALQYLPFGALPSPKSKVQGAKSGNGRQITGYGQPLIVEHEIVSLPSASTLAVLRRETATRARPTKNIAVLADPVFERDDERVNAAATVNRTVTKAGASSTDTNSELSNSRYLLERALGHGLKTASAEDGASREILRIQRLPFTRREADAILAIAPAGAGMKALDFHASRETATSAELAQYRIIHFATHGLLNSEHPELSGIVLSLVNEAGQPVDGFLRLHEIYNLKLNADMVVLSACQTGLGKEIRGEGLVGLTRGFMYAGSPRVVASLWKVDDTATAELMTRFYRGMLKDNLPPAAALRAAKVEMWKQKRWHAPFYWAAFELQGEWK